MSQDDKSFLNMAGEFAVASELNRRSLLASVTYGTSKSADVIVVDKDVKKVLRIEVKATDKKKWPLGPKIMNSSHVKSDFFWVLVQFPKALNETPDSESKRGEHSPRYFVLSAREIYRVWKKGSDSYKARYFKRHGKKYVGTEVPNVTITEVCKYEGGWEKISARLKK
jgi:hypothetical protein